MSAGAANEYCQKGSDRFERYQRICLLGQVTARKRGRFGDDGQTGADRCRIVTVVRGALWN